MEYLSYTNKIENKTHKIGLREIGFYLVLFLFVFIPFRSPLADLTTSALKAVPDVLVLLLFIGYSISIRFRYKFRIYDWFFLGFLAVGFISTVLVNHVGLSAFVFQVRSISVYYVLFFVLRNFEFGEREYCIAIKVLQIVACVLFVFAMVEKVTSKTVFFSQEVAESIIYPSNFARVYSLFYNPNTYGVFLSFVFFASCYKDYHYQKKSPIVVYVVLIASIFLSMSRSTLIIMVIGLALLALHVTLKKEWKMLWKKAVGYTAIVVACVAVITVALNALNGLYYREIIDKSEDINIQHQEVINGSLGVSTSDRLNEMGESEMYEASATNGRIYSVQTGLKVFIDHPVVGTGFGTFGSAASLNFKPAIYDQYDIPFPFYSDIEYIKVLVENGTIGTLLFAAFLCAILYRHRKDHFKILLCIIFGWFGFFYNIFEVQIAACIFWTLMSFKDNETVLKIGKKVGRKGDDNGDS